MPGSEPRTVQRPDRSVIWAAIIGSLIGAAAGLAGAWMGAALSSDAARDQDQRNFVREQRQQLYAQFLSQETALFTSAYMLASIPDDKSAMTDDQTEFYDSTFQDWADAALDLDVTINQIHIVGSNEAYHAAIEVQSAIDDMMTNADTLGGPTTADTDAIYAHVDNFVVVAQQDVTNN